MIGNANQPVIIWAVLIFTALAGALPGSFLGYNITGLSWFVPLFLSFAILIPHHRRISFPILVWLPWVVFILGYVALVDWSDLDMRVNPVQRAAQLIAPFLIGMAVSTYRYSDPDLRKFLYLLRVLSVLLVIFVFYHSGSRIMYDPKFSGGAGQVMTAMLLATVFINEYIYFRDKSSIFFYGLMLMLPVVLVTRAVMAVSFILAPISFNKMKLRARVNYILVALLLALFASSLPKVQQKSFFSGEGSFRDFSLSNPDFDTSGRSFIWENMFPEANAAPIFGHGIGSGETFTYAITTAGYPHNDWLLTYYDFGLVGVILFLITNILMLRKCLLIARTSQNDNIIFFATISASLFMPFLLVMYSDNIMIYASFFGLLHYTIIGITFGAYRQERMAQRVSVP